MHSYTKGIKNVIVLGSTTISSTQVNLISKLGFMHVRLTLNSDKAVFETTEKIVASFKTFAPYIRLTKVKIPKNIKIWTNGYLKLNNK